MNSAGFFKLIPRMTNTNRKLLTVGPRDKTGIDWKLSVLGFKGIHHTLVQWQQQSPKCQLFRHTEPYDATQIEGVWLYYKYFCLFLL